MKKEKRLMPGVESNMMTKSKVRIEPNVRFLLLMSLFTTAILLPEKAAATDLNNGRRLYMAHCAGCHGSDGNSLVPQTPNFSRGERLQQADFTIVNYIKTGSTRHPPFFGLIPEREMYDVVGYLRNIR